MIKNMNQIGFDFIYMYYESLRITHNNTINEYYLVLSHVFEIPDCFVCI